jgi:hypothetical protein
MTNSLNKTTYSLMLPPDHNRRILENHPFFRRDMTPVTGQEMTPAQQGLVAAYSILSIAGTALGAYHGYKRNDSVGWGIVWGLLGGAFPIIALPVAYAQGFGKRSR